MLWVQQIVVYTDHKNLMQKALGLTSDRAYRWRLIIEEYGPEIICIRGKHNTVADAILRLEFLPKADQKTDQKNWMILAKCWCAVSNTHTIKSNSINSTMDLNHVFANCSDKEEIYSLTVSEIAEEQTKDKGLQLQRRTSKFEETLIEKTYVLCTNGKMIITKTLQKFAVAWYHHYLQHLGHSCLEETLKAVMYWKNL